VGEGEGEGERESKIIVGLEDAEEGRESVRWRRYRGESLERRKIVIGKKREKSNTEVKRIEGTCEVI
jgi:hypothetical protein